MASVACWPQQQAAHSQHTRQRSSGATTQQQHTARCFSSSSSRPLQQQQLQQHMPAASLHHAAAAAAAAGGSSRRGSVARSCFSRCGCSQPHLQQQQPQPLQTRHKQQQQQLGLLQRAFVLGSRHQQPQQRLAHIVARAASQPPDPWQRPPGSAGTQWGSGSSSSGGSSRPPSPPPPPPPGGNGSTSPTASYDAWDAAAQPPPPSNGSRPRYEQTDWGWTGVPEDWDPAEGLNSEQLLDMQRDYLETLQRRRASQDPPRDKWITPLLDWQSISGAFDPDQSRTEDAMADEALTNKEESREALSFVARLVVIPLITGALISRAIADPVLSFSLQNNPEAFALSGHQKLEGAQALHMEETRVKMMMAIGQIPPLNEEGMLEHLHEFALEFQEEEREKNEASLMTLVSDSISAMVFFIMFLRDNDAREALFSTIGRLFEGLSDIAKAVMIILVADTLLGYHSEEGWTGFLDLFLGHYGIEVEEENIVLFVGIIPIAIDVLFKYWIFIGLNKISPGAVVTIKQLDRH